MPRPPKLTPQEAVAVCQEAIKLLPTDQTIVAADLSAATCGLCFWPSRALKTLLYPKPGVGVARFYAEEMGIIPNHKGATIPDLIILEGYSYLDVYSAQRIAEIVGIVKYLCGREQVPVEIIAPSAIKKTLTGYGRATKAEMQIAATALGFQVRSEHEADAVGLLATYAVKRDQ